MQKWKNRLYCLVFFTGFCIFIWLSANIIFFNTRFDNESTEALDNRWTVSVGKETSQVTLPAKIDARAGEKVIYSTVLKEKNIYANSLMIKAAHQFVQVYLGGKLLGDFGYDNKTPFGDAPFTGYLIVRLPQNWQGKTLSIEQIGYYDHYSGIMNTVYTGTKNALVFMMIKKCVPEIIINFSIILVCLCLLIASFFFKRQNLMKQLRYLSIFAIITGLWLILESGGYQLFTGNAPMVSNTIFILFSLIPIAVIRFIQTYPSFKKSRYMDVLYLLSLLNFLIIHILQFTKTADYIQSITGCHIIILLTFGGIVENLARTLKRKEKVKDIYLYISCIVFALFGCVDIVRFYMCSPASNSVIFSQIGLALFVILLMVSAVRKVIVDSENSLKKDFMQHLAFTDLLTELPNRNAFEKQMGAYRLSDNQKEPLIVLADLNGLKQINDTLGHTAGDAAITGVAHVLREVFPPLASVFRIGGDEFCILSDEMNEADAYSCLKDCAARLKTLSEEKNIHMSIAFGLSAEKGLDIDQAFIKADREMYKRKETMKN